MDWSYDSIGFFSANVSGAHPLPNGNIMICSGRQGDFFEVTPEKNKVWIYQNTATANGPLTQGLPSPSTTTFRATKYPKEFPGFLDKDLSPGDPVEMDPLPSECEIFENPIMTSTNDFELEGIRLYPNPVENQLQIVYEHQANDLEYQISDLKGQIILIGRLSTCLLYTSPSPRD